MIHSSLILHAAVAVQLLGCGAWTLAQSAINPGRVEYDFNHWVTAEDNGGLRLHVTSGEATREFYFPDSLRFSGPPVGSRLYEARYADEDSLWLVTQLGRRTDGAALLNLETGEMEAQCRGRNFTLSPDNQLVAYTYGQGGGPVFVNEMMVYPTVRPADTTGRAGLGGPEIPEASGSEMRLLSPLRWESASTLGFVVSERAVTAARPVSPEILRAAADRVGRTFLVHVEIDDPRVVGRRWATAVRVASPEAAVREAIRMRAAVIPEDEVQRMVEAMTVGDE